MTDMTDLLAEELDLLQEATNIFDYSYRKCKRFANRKKFTNDELEILDAFTSRFACLSDLIIQKMFKSIEKADLEDEGSIRDRINRAEKNGLIASAESFVEIRKLRNTIAHEYVPKLKEIVAKALEFSPLLLESVEMIKGYCKKNYGV